MSIQSDFLHETYEVEVEKLKRKIEQLERIIESVKSSIQYKAPEQIDPVTREHLLEVLTMVDDEDDDSEKKTPA